MEQLRPYKEDRMIGWLVQECPMTTGWGVQLRDGIVIQLKRATRMR